MGARKGSGGYGEESESDGHGAGHDGLVPGSMSGDAPGWRRHGHRGLLILPFLWQVGMVPFVNDIVWRPWSLPFPMVWQMAGVVLASIVIAIVFRLDQRIEPDEGDENATDGPLQ